MPKVPKNREKSAQQKESAKSPKGRARRRPMAEATDVQMLNFTARSVPLVFQQNSRARRIIMRLDYGSSRIVVVLPKRTSRDEGKRFVLSNKEWIAERLDQLPETVPFEHGAVIPFLGIDHCIRHRPTARGVVWCEDQEIHVAGQEAHLRRRVADWLKLEARREIEMRAHAKAEQIGRKIKRITIRDTKSRWGSCTSEGELSFSWRLVLAPRHVLDYVISHEIAHLKEMNHGPRFWKLCGELCRTVNASREWLEENGTELYRYGR
ncbi:MAG: M48 family peptidase [Rhodospirillaceae bacterium]|nr:MAG: M48 family peptidase [Rhodospirillaceae bacterium]